MLRVEVRGGQEVGPVGSYRLWFGVEFYHKASEKPLGRFVKTDMT